MKEELKEIKNELNATFEKPDAATEHIALFNEELLSASQEIQTTYGEKPVNGKFHTINGDYQVKSKNIFETNGDLNNYFRSKVTGQLFVNTDLILTKFSPDAAKHINLSDSDIGRHVSDITTIINFQTIVSDIKDVIAHNEVITREVEANNGKWYQIMTMPSLHQADNKIDGAIISFNDITELKLIQLERDRTNKSLMNINADLDNFVHAASHDLLGPLANIKLSIDIINQLKLSDDPQLHKFLAIINSSIKMFVELVREMATIGKVEQEMSVMELVDIHELINDLRLSIDNSIYSTGDVIKKDIGVTQIYFSKKNLRSILYNLISNAIKFKSPDREPEITISTKAEQGYAVLTVTDNGIGIPENEFENIFKMYGRLHKNVEGQGIGLYLIKKIVNAAGGKIIIKSQPGKGSIFAVYFKTETLPPIGGH